MTTVAWRHRSGGRRRSAPIGTVCRGARRARSARTWRGSSIQICSTPGEAVRAGTEVLAILDTRQEQARRWRLPPGRSARAGAAQLPTAWRSYGTTDPARRLKGGMRRRGAESHRGGRAVSAKSAPRSKTEDDSGAVVRRSLAFRRQVSEEASALAGGDPRCVAAAGRSNPRLRELRRAAAQAIRAGPRRRPSIRITTEGSNTVRRW